MTEIRAWVVSPEPIMRHPTLLPGIAAPAFILPNQRGEKQSLADYCLLGSVLVAFHRGTW